MSPSLQNLMNFSETSGISLNIDEFSSNNWPGKYGSNNSGNFSPWVVTSGLGVKINLGYFLLRVETAWDRNPSGYSKPQWYLSLGPDW